MTTNIVTIVDEDKPLALSIARELVGGHIIMFPLPDGSQLLLDEDGESKNLPLNLPASILAGFNVLGPAVLLRGDSRWLD